MHGILDILDMQETLGMLDMQEMVAILESLHGLEDILLGVN